MKNSFVDKKYYIKLIVGLIIGVVLWVIPPIQPLTQCGMRVLDLFVMILYFCAFNEMIWPGVLSVVNMLFIVNEIYPTNTTSALYRAMELSWGYWMIPFIAASLILAFALKECGFMDRVAVWILSRKIVQKNPWTFAIAWIFASLFLGLFFDPLATLVFFVGFSNQLFEKLGYKKGDAFPCAITICMGFAVMIAYGMTPISHPLPIMALGVFENMTGTSITFTQYMGACVPIGIVCFIGLICIFRFWMKPDVEKIAAVDLNQIINSNDNKKMELREKLTVIICLAVIASWLIFGIIATAAPNSQLNAFCSKLTTVTPALLGTALLAMIKVDGKPLMDIEYGLKHGVTWNVLLLLAGLLMTGNALAQDTTGFPALLKSILQPLLDSNISAFAVLFLVVAMAIICTNFLNNIPVVMLLLSACIPLAAPLGISAMAITALITYSGQMAFAAPSSFAAIAYLYGVDWAEPKKIFKYGCGLMILCVILVGTFGYFWANTIL